MPKSVFTARHYKLIAQAIKDSRSADSNIIYADLLIGILITTFRLDNPRFNPDVFRDACGGSASPL